MALFKHLTKIAYCLIFIAIFLIAASPSYANELKFDYQGSPGWWSTGSGYTAGSVKHLVSGDFNGDGKRDVAAMYDYGSGKTRLHVWLSTGKKFSYQGGSGWWGVSSGYNASRVKHLVSGDFNGDGRDDVAAMYDYGSGKTRIHVWLSTGKKFSYQGGSGWWGASSGYSASRVKHLVSGDFNGDGKDDIAAMYDYGSGKTRIHTWLSNGKRLRYQGGSGWWGVSSGYTASKVRHLVSGDFNGDGKDDVAAMYDYGSGKTRIHVWLSDGAKFNLQGSSGWWAASSGYTASKVRHLAAGDFNEDGKQDVAAMYDYGSGKTRIHTWLSNGKRLRYQGGSGWWGVSSGYIASKVRHLVSGDLNGDGKYDIAAMYDYGSGKTRIHTWLTSLHRLTFSGRRWGHGVGMCQYGSEGRARAGSKYTDILKYYYSETGIGNVNNVRLRIRLLVTSSAKITGTGNFIIENITGNTTTAIGSGSASQVWKVTPDGSKMLVKNHNGKTIGSYSGTVRFRSSSSSNLIKVDNNNRRYRGYIDIQLSGSSVKIINKVVLEHYTRGISEMPNSWSMEALKAQAVAARTYAYARKEREILPDQRDQVYVGYEKEVSSLGDRWVDAVTSTAGKTITHNGDVIDGAYYFSTCGGSTENVEDVWSSPRDYLKAKKDTYCSFSPVYSWKTTFTASELTQKLNSDSKTKIKGDLESIKVLSKTGPRIVDDVAIYGTEGVTTTKGSTLRNILGTSLVRSTWFSIY